MNYKINKLETASICLVPGFFASGVASGIKPLRKADLALVYSLRPLSVAGVFTRNAVKGDSLLYTQALLQAGTKPQALLINSGNANACVGEAGMQDARHMAATVAAALNIPTEAVLLGSTGVIGQRLPMGKVEPGIRAAVDALEMSVEAGHAAMRAIMTTDTVPKEEAVRVEFTSGNDDGAAGLDNADYLNFTIAGMAKGSGMIHPNMATMIGVITTDAPVSQSLLQEALSLVTSRTFNRTSVDGDMSVCDMVLLLNSAEDSLTDSLDSELGQAFVAALESVCTDLARAIARDGEGASRLINVVIDGAASENDAYLTALSIARSPLVKTAVFGADANWGRILTAAGYSGASFDPRKVDVWIGDVICCQDGAALDFDESLAKLAMQQDEITLRVDLKAGSYSDHYWTCDFSHDYVTINGSYRS